jgi:hypothetical protein
VISNTLFEHISWRTRSTGFYFWTFEKGDKLKKIFSLLVFILLGSVVLISTRGQVSTLDLSSLSSDDFVANEVLVQFSDNTDRSLALAIIDSVQGKVIIRPGNPGPDTQTIVVPPEREEPKDGRAQEDKKP